MSLSSYFGIFSMIIVTTLKVNSDRTPPLQLVPPWNETYRYENEAYQVRCIPNGPTTFIEWRNTRDKVVKSSHGRIRVKEHRDRSLTLIFEKVVLEEDDGKYACMAKVDGLELIQEFRLDVARKLQFNCVTEVAVLNENDAFLECKITGIPQPVISWEFKGNPLKPGGQYGYTEYGLYIAEATINNNNTGVYVCSAYQSPFQLSNNKRAIKLKIYHKPMFKRSESERYFYGTWNETANIICDVSAEPTAWFMWYRDESTIIKPIIDQVEIETRNNTSILEILLNSPRYEGAYKCEACNELGCVNRTFILKGVVKILQPVLHLWDVTHDKVDLYVSSQPDVTRYKFEYAYNFFDMGIRKWHHSNVTIFPKGNRTLGSYVLYSLDKLHPETKYVLRVTAENDFMTSDYSLEREFTTKLGKKYPITCSSRVDRGSIALIFLSFTYRFAIS